MNTWVKGLVAALVGGAVTGATDALGKGQVDKRTGLSAAVGAALGLVAYLKQSPIEPVVAKKEDTSSTK